MRRGHFSSPEPSFRVIRAAKGADATFIHAGTAASCRVDNFRTVDMIGYWKREQGRGWATQVEGEAGVSSA
jgi:hypothetical protein